MIRHFHSDHEGNWWTWLQGRRLLIPAIVLMGLLLAAVLFVPYMLLLDRFTAARVADVDGQPEVHATVTAVAVTPVIVTRNGRMIPSTVTANINGREATFRSVDLKIKPRDKFDIEYRLGRTGMLVVDRQFVDGRWVDVPLSTF